MKRNVLISALVLSMLVLTGVTILPIEHSPEREVAVLVQTSPLECIADTYPLFPEALGLWNKTWKTIHQKRQGKGLRSIAGADLKKLYEQQADADLQSYGLRIYYGLINKADSIPELIMVNTKMCQDVTTADAMLINPARTNKHSRIQWIKRDKARKYTQNWRDMPRLTGRTPVYAYNYSWSQVKELVGPDFSKNLNIVYGLRTLSPEETQTQYLPASVSSEGTEARRFGSIVYVNVLYASTKVAKDYKEEDPGIYNFSRPCPKYCDPEEEE